jgi:hypothetical protein
MKTKLFWQTAIIALLITALSCKKKLIPELPNAGLMSTQFYSSLNCNIRYSNGFLVFQNRKCFERVLDSLDMANNNYYAANPNDSTEFKAFELFEQNFPQFYSKRKQIEVTENQMLEDETWTLESDPDDFPVEEDAFRTLINQQGIVAINDTIFVFRNEGDYAIFRTSQKNNLLNNLNEFLTAANSNNLGNFLAQNNFISELLLIEEDNCRPRQGRTILHEYTSGRRIKCKVVVRAGVFRGYWGAKTVHFVKNNRGKWKRTKADVLYAGYAGTLFDRFCENSQSVSGVKEEKNRVKVVEGNKSNAGLFQYLRVQRESFGSAHSVTYNGNVYDYFITITW